MQKNTLALGYSFFHAMNQVLLEYPWSLEVLSKIFLGLKGHFHRVLFLIYVIPKKPYQMVLSYIPDRFGNAVLRNELVP